VTGRVNLTSWWIALTRSTEAFGRRSRRPCRPVDRRAGSAARNTPSGVWRPACYISSVYSKSNSSTARPGCGSARIETATATQYGLPKSESNQGGGVYPPDALGVLDSTGSPTPRRSRARPESPSLGASDAQRSEPPFVLCQGGLGHCRCGGVRRVDPLGEVPPPFRPTRAGDWPPGRAIIRHSSIWVTSDCWSTRSTSTATEQVSGMSRDVTGPWLRGGSGCRAEGLVDPQPFPPDLPTPANRRTGQIQPDVAHRPDQRVVLEQGRSTSTACSSTAQARTPNRGSSSSPVGARATAEVGSICSNVNCRTIATGRRPRRIQQLRPGRRSAALLPSQPSYPIPKLATAGDSSGDLVRLLSVGAVATDDRTSVTTNRRSLQHE